MKPILIALSTAIFAANLIAADADPKAAIKAGAAKLGSQASYSWTSTPKSEGAQNFRAGPTEGKTEKDGWTHTKASFNDNTIETVLKGDKFAVKRDADWQTAADLEGDDRGAFMVRRLKAFKAPAAEAEDLAGKSQELKKAEDGSIGGELTADGAKELLAFGRRGGNNTGPADAKGSVKFWLKDGTLNKYEYTLSGTVTRQGGEEMKINRTVTVEIKDIGSTKVTVPDDVKKKLS